MALPSDAAHGRGHVSRSGGGMKTTNKPLGSPIMNKQLKKQLLATAIAAAGVMPMLAYAQAHSGHRSEEHTSELQSLMRISYAVFCLKKKTHNTNRNKNKIEQSA